jgi:hypothetical protein
MNDIFQLLASGITFAWDPEELTKNFPVVSDTKGNIISASNEAHWQYFITGIYFSRNFSKEFPDICGQVIDTLEKIQNKFRISNESSYLIDIFLEHTFSINNVLLIKVASGKSVDLHFDSTRYFAVNIGLKNSDTCLTHLYSGNRVEGTMIDEKNVKHTIQMNDGDVYLIATHQPHCVESLTSVSENRDRYLISYCLV